MQYLFASDKKAPRARKSYEVRAGMNTRAAVSLAAAVVLKPATIEDEDGNVIRLWKKTEMSSYTNSDLADCLRNRIAVEANEMLGTVPPSAIKYCVTKGWLVTNGSATLYYVTLKAAIDLDLPLSYKGGQFKGRKIRFVK